MTKTATPGVNSRAVLLQHDVGAGAAREQRAFTADEMSSGKVDFESVLKTHGDSVFNTLFRLTGDFHLSEDLFQETFIKVYKGLGGYDGRAKISTWLYSIALNTFKDHKRRKAIPAYNLPDDDKLREMSPSPDKSLIRTEEKNALLRELRKLKESLRIPLILFYLEEMTVREIAGITKRTQSDIKVSLHRGREILKKRLRREA